MLDDVLRMDVGERIVYFLIGLIPRREKKLASHHPLLVRQRQQEGDWTTRTSSYECE